MKKIYNYIMLFMLALVAVCCSEEDLVTPANPAKSGDDVQFGLSLENLSRTIYGNETSVTTNNVTTNYFPIYWVNGDKVQIFSPQCLEGRRNAEYQVILPKNVTNPNYADNLTKTGEIGVQWGNGETADFYSLYPSGNYTLSSDGTKAENIFINYSQSIIVDGATVKSDMEDCLMYAKKTSVPRGEVVNLQYDPISTVFMVTLNVPEGSADDFIIQSVSLEAPDGVDIAGTFSLNISDGSFGAWGNNKAKSVSAQIYDKATGGYYTLAKGKSVQIPLFIAPIMDQDNPEVLTIEGWKIKVVANQKEYVKTLAKQTIKPGKVHKVTLPNLSTTAVVEWDVATWMKYIPRNVYLSEVSIPGSWNSLNSDFQGSYTDIATQYNAGVRAFHIDTRWKRTGSVIFGGYNWSLGTADGGSSTTHWGDDRVMTSSSNPTFESSLNTITSNVKDDEYMVVICSFAQHSYNHEGSNGYWYDEISKICDKNSTVFNARNITSNTVVGDVLGKVIVIVNMPQPITSSTALPTDSKCFFTYMPSNLSSSHFNGTDDNKDALWIALTSTDTSGVETAAATTSDITIHNNQAQISSNSTSGIQHEDRGYAPTLTERTGILDGILLWSKENYGNDDYLHNQWIYLGLGGYQVSSASSDAVEGSYVTIEKKYNKWINDKVNEMGTTPSDQTNVVPFYPVGITLMNFVCDKTNVIDTYKDDEGNTINVYSTDVVKNILLLNNKYRLQYDPTKPADYNPNYKNEGDYDGTGGEGGDIL